MNQDTKKTPPQCLEDPVTDETPLHRKMIPLKLSAPLAMQIEKRVNKKKQAGYYGYSKTQWIVEAMQERLAKDETNPPKLQAFLKPKLFSLRLASGLLRRIQKQVAYLKRYKPGCNRTTWIIEAIEQKLKK